MTLSERVRRHIQSNVIGYLALFVALSGTALALPGHKSVKSDDLANGAVTGKALASGVVSAAKIRTNAVTAPKLGGAAVTASALADGSVTTPKLLDDSVIRQKIAQGEINGGKLANGAINSSKVADGTLLAEDFAPGQISDGFVRSGDGPFTIQRGGRIYATATLLSTCPAGPCNDSYGFQVDGVPVPGASLTRPGQTGVQQLTLIGLTATLAAGTHTIELTKVSVGSTETQLSFGGILLQ